MDRDINFERREVRLGTRKTRDGTMEYEWLPMTDKLFEELWSFIKELVRQGKGITFITRMSLDKELETLVQIPLEEGPLMLETDVVIHKEKRLSRSDRAFSAVLFKNAVDRDAIKLPHDLLL